MKKTVLLVGLLFCSLFASGQEYLEMLSGNPIWSHYEARYPIDWASTPYDPLMVEIYGFHYYGYGYNEVPNDLKFIEQEPEFTYFFIDGTEEYNGREYKVLKRMDVNDALANGFNPERFHKELLVREEAGKVYADIELFKMHRYEHVALDDEFDYKEFSEIAYPLDWAYNIEGDEVVLYDFTSKKGDRIGEYGTHVKYISSWIGLDGIERKDMELNSQHIIEGVGLTLWTYGSPMLAYEPLIMIDSYSGDYFDVDQGYRSTFNMFYQNDQFVLKAASRYSGEPASELQRLNAKYSSYIEPPFFAELKAYLAGEWSPTSIISASSASTPSRISDLSGRRLNAIPDKGMYIKDGKKYVVK